MALVFVDIADPMTGIIVDAVGRMTDILVSAVSPRTDIVGGAYLVTAIIVIMTTPTTDIATSPDP
jgi:hypothetical protein